VERLRPVPGVEQAIDRTTDGDLVECDHTSFAYRPWNASDLTQDASETETITGRPSPVVNGTSAEVFARGSGGTTIGGDPGALLHGGASLHVYAVGPQPATMPAGVGQYGLDPGAQTSQAIEGRLAESSVTPGRSGPSQPPSPAPA
jgi:hypothetical protein